MTLDALIMLSGTFVAVLPFLGFPNSWDAAFFLIAGIFIVALGVAVRRRIHKKGERHEEDAFAEHDANN